MFTGSAALHPMWSLHGKLLLQHMQLLRRWCKLLVFHFPSKFLTLLWSICINNLFSRPGLKKSISLQWMWNMQVRHLFLFWFYPFHYHLHPWWILTKSHTCAGNCRVGGKENFFHCNKCGTIPKFSIVRTLNFFWLCHLCSREPIMFFSRMLLFNHVEGFT